MHPHWVHAMNDEITALKDNKTWTLTTSPPTHERKILAVTGSTKPSSNLMAPLKGTKQCDPLSRTGKNRVIKIVV